MAEPVKTVIGFDFGTHWIGVAVGQTLTRQASPLGALKNNDWNGIEKLLREWQPELLIVGLPLGFVLPPKKCSIRLPANGLKGPEFGMLTIMNT